MLTLLHVSERSSRVQSGAETHRVHPVDPPAFALAEAHARPRVGPLALSMMVHVGGAAAVLWLSVWIAETQPMTPYSQLMAPRRPEIVWYRPSARQIPRVAPLSDAHRSARAPERRRLEVVSAPPRAPQGRELVYHQAPKIRIKADLNAANVVVRKVDAPAPAKPKDFVQPSARPTAVRQPVLEAEGPQLAAAAASASQLQSPGLPGYKVHPRPFGAPGGGLPAKPSGPVLVDAPALPVAPGADIRAGAMPGVAGGARGFVPPPPSRTGTGRQGRGTGGEVLDEAGPQISAAILSNEPGPRILLEVPEGVRSARFGSAAEAGALQPGSSGTDSVRLPSVSVEPPPGVSGPPGGAPKPAATLPVTRLSQPKDGRFSIVVLGGGALDVLPEARGRLTGKPVYTVYLPVGLRRKWMLQYCLPAAAGKVPSLEAPWPHTIARPDIPAAMVTDMVLVHGRINVKGRFEALRVLRPSNLAVESLLVHAFGQWEFRPALASGQPVEVEVLIGIPRAD